MKREKGLIKNATAIIKGLIITRRYIVSAYQVGSIKYTSKFVDECKRVLLLTWSKRYEVGVFASWNIVY